MNGPLPSSTLRSSTLRGGQLAEAAGLNHQTLRYYERRGCRPTRTGRWAVTGCTRRKRSPC